MRHLAFPLAALLIVGCAGADAPAGDAAVAAHQLAPFEAPADPADVGSTGDAHIDPTPDVSIWPDTIPLPAVGSLTRIPEDDRHLLAWGLEGDGTAALDGYLELLGSAGFTPIDIPGDTHRLSSEHWEVTVTVTEQAGGLDIELAATPTDTASD